MELLFIAGVAAALWLWFKPRRSSAPGRTVVPGDAGSTSIAAYWPPYVEGAAYNLPDATLYASEDGLATGTDYSAIDLYNLYLETGVQIEPPQAPARPSSRKGNA